jgi:hypothetical protein
MALVAPAICPIRSYPDFSTANVGSNSSNVTDRAYGMKVGYIIQHMPFSPVVKARLFVRCARICCLCFKQCGTRIEAAHIVAEADSGSNDDENAIPLCFDCHEEIGSYNPRHPKGNKFTAEELLQRRDALYQLVEKGVIQAQIVAHRLGVIQQSQGSSSATHSAEQAASAVSYVPTQDAETVLAEALSPIATIETFPRKLQLLSERDRAYVLDQLVQRFSKGAGAEALMNLIGKDSDANQSLILLEQIVRQATLGGTAEARAKLMQLVPLNLFMQVNEGLRQTFFEDAVAIMERDQYVEVNLLTPAITKVQGALPPEIRRSYIKALISQAKSSARHGAPAARAALSNLPQELVAAAFEVLDGTTLYWEGQNPWVKQFLSQHQSSWPETRATIYGDYLALNLLDFGAKHSGIECL